MVILNMSLTKFNHFGIKSHPVISRTFTFTHETYMKITELDPDRIGPKLAETPTYRVYLYNLPEGGHAFLKIAIEVANNGLLDREAALLQFMKEKAEELEVKYAASQPDTGSPKATLNYQSCFPEVIGNFVCPDQGDRRVLILVSTAAKGSLDNLVPLSKIRSQDRARVDPKTSAWILGKFLKLLAFTQSYGISNRQLDGDNMLINREQHMIILFDWSDVSEAPGGRLSEGELISEVSVVAREVILLLGGDPETGQLPSDPQIDGSTYADVVFDMVQCKSGGAKKAHAEFYKFIYALWPRGFHPYTAYSL